SGASGCGPATAEERSFLESVAAGTDMAVRAAGSLAGHGLEAQFILNLALAAMVVRDGSLFPARDASGMEGALKGAPRHAMVTGWGHWRGEATGLVEAVG
ncbi:MAG: hypothetical protein AB7L41_15640, partial [Flavobacteriaceae bacterium]